MYNQFYVYKNGYLFPYTFNEITVACDFAYTKGADYVVSAETGEILVEMGE